MRAAQRIKIETNNSGDKLEPLAHHSSSNLLMPMPPSSHAGR
jgi:hypothetical protein